MSLKDFISPKWKHSNPEIRLAAVEDMDTDSMDILTKIIVTDPEPGIRIKAAEKITDEKILEETAANDKDEGVRNAVSSRLNSIYYRTISGIGDIEEMMTTLAKIQDEEILTRIACETIDPSIRMKIVEQIDNPLLLCRISESNCGVKPGLAIIAKLSDIESLKRIAKNASGKKIRKKAEDKLDAILNPPREKSREEVLAADLEIICADIEELLTAENKTARIGTQGEARLKKGETAWQNHDPDNSHPLRARFDTAKKQVETILDRLQEAEKTRILLETLCNDLESLNDDLKSNAEIKPDEASDRFNNTVRTWESTDMDMLAEAAVNPLNIRFSNARQNFDATLAKARAKQDSIKSCIRKLESLCLAMKALVSDAGKKPVSDKDLEKCQDLCEKWDQSYEKSTETESLKEMFKAAEAEFYAKREDIEKTRQEEEGKIRQRLESLIENVCTLIDSKNRAGLDKKVRNAQKQWNDIAGPLAEIKTELEPRFEKACLDFFEKQHEYYENRDWEYWANLNRKKELCEKVEALGAVEILDDMANHVREAQKQWKETGPVSKDESDAIWNRFKQACDLIYERCLNLKNELYQEALSVYSKIEPQVESEESDSEPKTDDESKNKGIDKNGQKPVVSINWKETGDKIKVIQTAYNKIGTLPKALEGELRNKFSDVCNAVFEKRRDFFQNLDDSRKKNLETKKALHEEALSLADSTDWSRTGSRLKRLQQRWKETGPIPKKEGDKLWHEFRQACNQFFERMENEKPENLSKKKLLCEQAEALVASVNEDNRTESVARQLIDLQKEWKKTGPVPETESENIWNRFRKPCDEFFAKRKEVMAQRDEDYAKNQELKEELVRQAEKTAPSDNWKETADKLKTLQKEWKEIGPSPRPVEQELWTRFRGACDSFFNRRKAFFNSLDKTRTENLKKKKALCATLEVVTRLAFPQSNASENGGIVTAAQQLSMALDLKNEIVVPADPRTTIARAFNKVKDIQTEWKKTGPVPGSEDKALWDKYRRALDLFFAARASWLDSKNENSKNSVNSKK